MYLDFVIAIRLAAGNMHFKEMLQLALRLTRTSLRVLQAAIDQPVFLISRWRERRAATRAARPPRSSDASDEDRGLGVTCGSLAPA